MTTVCGSSVKNRKFPIILIELVGIVISKYNLMYFEVFYYSQSSFEPFHATIYENVAEKWLLLWKYPERNKQ